MGFSGIGVKVKENSVCPEEIIKNDSIIMIYDNIIIIEYWITVFS